jgi:16S rRNA processing protein RimM
MQGRRDEADPVGHVVVGQIVAPFGLKGGLKVVPMTDFPARFEKGAIIYLAGEPRRILEASWHKTQVRVSIEGVQTINEAEALCWKYLTVPDTDKPILEEDEYMASDLIGLAVVENGQVIGQVDEVVHYPAHDLLRIGETLVPCVKQFVKAIDLEARTVTVELIEGMRPGEAAEKVR